MGIRAKTTFANFNRVAEWIANSSSHQIIIHNDDYYQYIDIQGEDVNTPLFSWVEPSLVTSEFPVLGFLFQELAETITRIPLGVYFNDTEELLSIGRTLVDKDITGLLLLLLEIAFKEDVQAFTDFVFNYLDTENAATFFNQSISDKTRFLEIFTTRITDCFVRYSRKSYFPLERDFSLIIQFFQEKYEKEIYIYCSNCGSDKLNKKLVPLGEIYFCKDCSHSFYILEVCSL